MENIPQRCWWMPLRNHVLQHEEGVYITQYSNVLIPIHDASNPSLSSLNPHSSHFLQAALLQIFWGNGSHRHALPQLLTFPTNSLYTLHTPFLQYQRMCIPPPGQSQSFALDIQSNRPTRTCCSKFPGLSPICSTSSHLALWSRPELFLSPLVPLIFLH